MSTYYIAGFSASEELYHYGTPRMQWGIRKYQNYDGTLTEAGKLRYRKYSDAYKNKAEKTKKKLEKAESNLSNATERGRELEYEKARLENSAKDIDRKYEKEINEKPRLWGAAYRYYQPSERLQKKAAKIEARLDSVRYEENKVKIYKYKYENKVDRLMRKIGKYEANSVLYGDLSDKGISKNYDKIQERLKT